ncbi:hypothetical protein FXO38_04770 [Capsicum annuum]|nr:hypothetical protein FXO38_04770 [Capsicum annuum]KAF3678245.1 hypothetical protein FXO37_04467 [Capsicum annuum]
MEKPTVPGNDTTSPAQMIAGKDFSNPLMGVRSPMNAARPTISGNDAASPAQTIAGPPEQRPGISLIPREETRSPRTGTRLGLSNGESDEYEREYNSAMYQFSQDPNTDDNSGMEFDSEALHNSDT